MSKVINNLRSTFSDFCQKRTFWAINDGFGNKAGKFMLLAHGTHSEVEKAREILGIGDGILI